MALPPNWPRTYPILPGIYYGVVISLYSADPVYEFEVQRATDALGTGATTIASKIPSTQKTYVDKLGNNDTVYYYRTRHTLEGETESSWTCWKAGTPQLLAGDSPEQAAPILPIIATAMSFDGTTGTLTITPDDAQCRITKVEAQTTTSGGTVGTLTELVAVAGVYTQTVPQGGPAGAKIKWVVTGYNAKGELGILGTETLVFPVGSGSSSGPSLDVRAVGGATQWTIYWSGTGVTLSINGGSYATPPASPIIVTRPAAGAQDLVYTFKNDLNGQTVTNSVIVPSIDKDTIPADLVVSQGTMDGLVVPFTASATRGDTGASIGAQVRVIGCTGTNNGVAFSEGSGWVAVAGAIVANRPAFGDVSGNIQFRSTPTAGVTGEEASRTVLRQEKVSFGPDLTVTPTPSANSYSIAWSGDNVELSIDGGGYSAAPASPIVVTRNAVGGASKVYTFKGFLDQQTVTNAVEVPPKGAKDTPDLTVSQGAMTDTTIPFTANFSAPGGSSVTCVVYFVDCTADVANGYTLSNGQTINVNRPTFGNKAGTVRFNASISGGGIEEISRTVVTQIKTSFGPTLDISVAVSSTQYTISFNAPGATVEYSIDTGGHLSASSPIIVTRPDFNSPDKTVHLFATKDGQMISNSVVVVAKPRDTMGSRLSLDRAVYTDLGGGVGHWAVYWRFYERLVGGGEFEPSGIGMWFTYSNVGTAKQMDGTSLSVSNDSGSSGPHVTGINNVPYGEAVSLNIIVGQGGQAWDGSNSIPQTGATLDLVLPAQ